MSLCARDGNPDIVNFRKELSINVGMVGNLRRSGNT